MALTAGLAVAELMARLPAPLQDLLSSILSRELDEAECDARIAALDDRIHDYMTTEALEEIQEEFEALKNQEHLRLVNAHEAWARDASWNEREAYVRAVSEGNRLRNAKVSRWALEHMEQTGSDEMNDSLPTQQNAPSSSTVDPAWYDILFEQILRHGQDLARECQVFVVRARDELSGRWSDFQVSLNRF